MAPDLNEKQRRFALEYMVDQNATQAAIRAGYAKGSAHVTANRLLRNAKIAALIANKGQKIEQKLEISVEKTLQELARIGFSDPVEVLDEDGKLLPVSQWPENARRAISSIKTRRVMEGSGEDAHEVEIVEVKFWDKNSALDKLARHLAIYKDITEVNINVRIGQMTDEELDTLIATELGAQGAAVH